MIKIYLFKLCSIACYTRRQQLSVVTSLLTGHIGLNGHLYKIGKDINPLCRRRLSGNETVEHLLCVTSTPTRPVDNVVITTKGLQDLLCACESLTMSRGRIFGQSFGELQQLLHVPVDLFRRFATEIGLAEK